MCNYYYFYIIIIIIIVGISSSSISITIVIFIIIIIGVIIAVITYNVSLLAQLQLCFFAPQVYVLKRPHVDEFLRKVGELFECVLFTASLAKVSF